MKEFLYVTEGTKLGVFGAKIAGIFKYSIRMGKNVERFTNLRSGHAKIPLRSDLSSSSTLYIS